MHLLPLRVRPLFQPELQLLECCLAGPGAQAVDPLVLIGGTLLELGAERADLCIDGWAVTHRSAGPVELLAAVGVQVFPDDSQHLQRATPGGWRWLWSVVVFASTWEGSVAHRKQLGTVQEPASLHSMQEAIIHRTPPVGAAGG